MSTTRVHVTTSILAAVLAFSLFLAALMLGSSGLTNTPGNRTYECGSAWNIGTRPDSPGTVTFVGFGPEAGDYTYDGITGCDQVKSSRNRLAIAVACLGLLAAAGALLEARRYRSRRAASSTPAGGVGGTL